MEIKHGVGGFEMEFGDFAEDFGAVTCDEIPRGLDHRGRGAEREMDATGGGGVIHPVDEPLASEDGCCGDGGVGFALGALFELER